MTKKNNQKKEKAKEKENKKRNLKLKKRLSAIKTKKTKLKSKKKETQKLNQSFQEYKEENENTSSIEKKSNYLKYKLYSLNKIVSLVRDKFLKRKNKNYETLIKLFNIFDLDNNINSLFFSALRQKNINIFRNLIDKYKYTFDYKSAVAFDCLSKEDIKTELDLYNNYMIHIKGKSLKEKDITSFSKIKFFNLLIDILKKDPSDNKYFLRDKIKDNIEEMKLRYNIKEEILFKSPNTFGNFELKYYTLIYLFYQYFFRDDINNYNGIDLIERNNNDDDIDKQNINGIVEPVLIYFNDSTYINNFNELKDEYNNKKIVMKMIKKSKIENNNNSDDRFDKIFKEKLSLFLLYKESLQEIIKFEIKEDEKIIGKCEFILYSFYLGDKAQIKEISHCLANETNSESKKIYFKNFPKNWDYNELCSFNLDVATDWDNLFSNLSSNFKYPFILKKNSLMNIEEIYNSFLNFIKEIYKSNLMKEIYYNTQEFNNFLYPYEDDDILNELFNNTIFLPFYNNKKIYGYTEKLLAKIYISSNFNDNFEIEPLIIFFANLLITILHEQAKHYIKLLIYFNSFIYKENCEILGDNDVKVEKEDNQIFLNILRNTEKYNNPKKTSFILPEEIDGGHKLEILLFGKILGDISILGALDIFRFSTWKKNIKEHLERFIKINSMNEYEKELLNERKKFNNFNIKIIENDQDYPQFLKLLLKEFIKTKNIKDGNIEINIKYSSKRKIIDADAHISFNVKFSQNFIRNGSDCKTKF